VRSGGSSGGRYGKDGGALRGRIHRFAGFSPFGLALSGPRGDEQRCIRFVGVADGLEYWVGGDRRHDRAQTRTSATWERSVVGPQFGLCEVGLGFGAAHGPVRQVDTTFRGT